MKKRLADIIIEELLKRGIDTCFGVVGGGAMFLDDALRKNKKIKKYFNHNEQASAMAAEAYARYSGKPAVVCVTSGPGATNTITGVVGAWQDSIPMFVLSGQVRYEISVPECGLNLRYRGIQEYQMMAPAMYMTKYAATVIDPLSIICEIDKAYHIAMDGRRGPVWLEIPLDIQNAMVDEDELYRPVHFKSEIPEIVDDDIVEVFNILQLSKRPCILSGSGIRSSDNIEKFYNFVESVGIPFIGASWVVDSGYDDHPLFYGMSGNIGPRMGNFILQNADCLLVLGNSLGFRQTGFNLEKFAPNAKIIMVDVDEDESKKPGLRIFKFLHCDVGDFFDKALIYNRRIIVEESWIRYCDELKKRFDKFEGAKGKDDGQRVNSYRFWKTFGKYEEDDSVLALGNNTGCSAKFQIGIKMKDQRVITNYTCGSMGYDIPAAIGATIASGRKVYCITGDGSIMMNLQELQTVRHYDLPIHVIVFNNDGYNAIRQTGKSFFGGKYIGCSPETGISFPNFEDVANTFGFKYRKCESNGQLEEEIKNIISCSQRVLLEVMQAFDDPVVPKLMSKLDENGVMQTPELQDMYPFIDRDEYSRLMIERVNDVL